MLAASDASEGGAGRSTPREGATPLSLAGPASRYLDPLAFSGRSVLPQLDLDRHPARFTHAASRR
jgi:hypothetical protein